MELEENIPLLEWLANNYKKFGAALEIITGELIVLKYSAKFQLLFFQIGVKKVASTLGGSVGLGECYGTQWIFSRFSLMNWMRNLT